MIFYWQKSSIEDSKMGSIEDTHNLLTEYPVIQFLLCRTGIKQMLYLNETLDIDDVKGCFEKLKSSFSRQLWDTFVKNQAEGC
jgi:hypothetical protein